MDEFAALVKKGGVVFVGFDDECGPHAPHRVWFAAPGAGLALRFAGAWGRALLGAARRGGGPHAPHCVWFAAPGAAGRIGLASGRSAESGRNPKIQRHPANQKAGVAPGAFQNPGQHGGGGGFAVGAGYGQHMAALQNVFGQPLRAAGVGQPLLHDGLHQRKLGLAAGQPGAADHVAHHEHVGRGAQLRELVGGKTFDQVDAQGPQLIAHGRVNARVTTRYRVARFARQRCHAAHEGAANAQNVNMHALRISVKSKST